MNKYNISKIVRRQNFSLSDQEVGFVTDGIIQVYENHTFDFSKASRTIYTQQGKKRVIYQYPDKLSPENILTKYLKSQMDSAFKIHYASRGKIMNLLFNILPVVKDLNDFVIIRTDFKSFFDSVYTQYVFDHYIETSSLCREDKELLEEYVKAFKYCYAGLCLSNSMTEVICRDFDYRIQAALSDYGVFFYERYVDDILLITNRYISEDKFRKIMNQTIKDVFGDCPVKLNDKPEKFKMISRRNIQNSQSFNFLGYEFDIQNDGSQQGSKKSKITFKYGMTVKKRKKYEGIIENAFIQYRNVMNSQSSTAEKSCALELLRQRLKLYSSRVVIARTVGSSSYDWITKGVVANYNELHYHIDDLNQETISFLNCLYLHLCKKYKIMELPYFLKDSFKKDSIYNIYSCMQRNRSLIFEKNIGVSRKTLLKWIRKLQPLYDDKGKDYYRVVADYLELVKI